MRVMLNEQYGITSDENNFILFEVKVRGKDAKEAGESYEATVGYYGTLEACLRGFSKNSLRKNNEIDGMDDLIKAIDKLSETISKSVLTGIKKGK